MTPDACDACLRRTDLLAALAARLDIEWRRRTAPAGVLSLPDDALVALDPTGAAARRHRGFRAPGARERIAAAGLVAVCRCSAAYPDALRELADPPAVLHVAGDPGAMRGAGSVAVVGARRGTPYGLEVARSLGRGISAAGMTVVSGLALGVDSAAHVGALSGRPELSLDHTPSFSAPGPGPSPTAPWPGASSSALGPGASSAALGPGASSAAPGPGPSAAAPGPGASSSAPGPGPSSAAPGAGASPSEPGAFDGEGSPPGSPPDRRPPGPGHVVFAASPGAAAPAVAVLAGGADVPYPARNRRLHRHVAAAGCVVSELPPGFTPHRWAFVARNRIIAGLAAMTVVVEATERSGSLTTADFAAQAGRVVGAVPGPVTSRFSAGTNDLLAAGAVVVRDARDVLDVVAGPGTRDAAAHADRVSPPEPLEPHLRRLLRAVERGLGTPAELAREADAFGRVLHDLTELELRGLVRRDFGGRYVRALDRP